MIIRNVRLETQEESVAQAHNADAVSLQGAKGFACVVEATVATPSAKTFDSEVKADVVIQDLTYVAKLTGDAGNDISVAYVDPEAAGETLAVDVTDTAIVVTLGTSPEVFEEQTLSFDATPDDGGITYEYDGSTATIQHDEGAATLQVLLRLIAGLEDVTVTGDFANDFVVTFVGVHENAIQLTVFANTLTASATPVEPTITTTEAYDAGGTITSDADAIKAAIEAEEDADDLVTVTVSGTGSDLQTAQAETNLEDGADSEIDLDANTLTIPSHGFATGLKGQLTTTGSLPTGLSTSTDYFAIVVDDDTIKLASSLNNANAGTAINITGDGSGVHTFTATSLASASVKLQSSLDGDAWFDIANTSNNITTTANFFVLEKVDPMYDRVRAVYAVGAGQLSVKTKYLLKGE